MNVFKIGNLNLVAVTKIDVIRFIKDNIAKVNGYVCVTNTRTAYLSSKDNSYCTIQNNSLITIPDGMPLVWLGKLSGYKNIQRTAGPELFEHFLRNEDKKIKHYLLGDTQEVLNKLITKAKVEYGANIVGSFSPPFSSLEEYNYKQIANGINNSKADIVWLALGSPKQDIFASKLMQHTDNKIILNVGAAFRFVLGEYNMPPKAIQKLGLTGVYWRFLQKPTLFIKQYPKYFIFIIKNAIKIKFKKLK
ncbi:WecB/TagA/CpsF family glycosyltransferase [Polaribacter sp. KT 15]|uniref:WecB/TagA/CpsF family glycosyltransferase n=1 Tax=Polaribacter sp. KT 15 TaxID=1896175 RepID=UPI000909BFB0|nr:WecB/TagA/CpsF family glycosyltransferase [Polaribacter sp. KT 15]SHN00975.1 N-acetylglucosaminyldiphosphoundecaprenol N-acetyl-beta-D-mannosaminyltransferase [Polaribacter sp. KT 15]